MPLPATLARRDRARYLEELRIRAIVRDELRAVDNSVDNPRAIGGDYRGGPLTVESEGTPLVSTPRIRHVESRRGGQLGTMTERELIRGYGLDLEEPEP